MYARVTAFDIDLTRIGLDEALERFKSLILPALRQQEGYEGLYVLRTPEGKGLLVSLWTSEEAAAAGIASGYYDEQVRKFLTLYRQPPGREHYEVVLAENPVGAVPGSASTSG